MSTKPTAAPLPAVAAAAAGQRLAPSVEAAVAAAAEAGAVTSSTPAPVAGGAGVAAAVLAGGQVVSVEGSAWLQVPGQAPQPLSAGATVPPGAVMLAAADAVVRLSRPQSLGAKMAAKGGLDKLIADFDKGAGETAPAAGVAGGDETTAEGGLRVDRVSEATTTAGLGTSGSGGSGGSGTGAEFPTAGTAGGTPDGTTPTPSPSIVLDNPGLTGDATPRISGSTDLAPGSLVTVTVTDANGQVQVITATVGSDGRFAVDPAPLPDGNFSINVQAENTTVTTGGTVDTTPPTLRLDPVAITGDNTPAISGQSNLPAGSTVTVTVVDATGKSQELTATIGSDGRFSVSPGQNLSDGRYTVQVVATDAAGNAQTTTTTGVVDTQAPSVSVDAPDLSNSTQPTVSGRTDLPSGTLIEVKITDANGQTQTTQATVRPDGSFSLTPSTPLPDGPFTVEVTGRDAAGNPSTSTSTGTVDSTAPLSPSMGSVVDNQGPIQGQLNPGGATDDSRPTFNGTAEPGSTVTVYTNGVPIGTAPVAPNGTWSFTPEVPLPAGPNSITTTATDPAGNTGPSSQPFALTVDVGAPQVPSIISATDNITPVEGLLTKGSGTNDNTPTINGYGRPGETVTLFADGQPVGSVVVNAKGEWSITPSALADKTWNFTAEAVNIHGVHSPVTGAWPLTVDTQAPRQVAVDSVTDNAGPVRGEITEGSTTDDATPTWQGKNAEPGSTITVYDKGVALGSTTVAPDGTWRFTPPVALPDGPHSLSITATDAVGNVSPATAPLNFSIDTSQVSSPTIDSVTEAGVAGEVPMAFNQASNDTTPTLSGSSKPNQVVQVFDGETLLGQTVADASGQWRFTPSTPLPDGPHDFVAVSLNAAGVPSEPSNAFRVVVDTVAPDAPPSLLISDDVGRVQGSLQNGDSTDDNTPTFSGSGANPGDTITVLDGGQPVGTTVVKPDGTWTLTPLTPLTPGAHQFTLTATDPAGNTSAPSAPFALTIDIAPPDAPTIGGIFDNTGAVVGELAPGATTDDAKPTVWGSAEPGSTVEVFDGDTLLGRATTGPDGYWTFTPTLPLLLGEHEITARAVDAAGNTSAASAPRDFNLMDDAPPSAPAIVNVIDDQGTVQGHVAKSTGITDDTQPSIRGTAEPGAVITVRDGSTVLGTATTDSSGRWAFTPTTPLADGPHAITVTATNAAGNVSAATGIYDFVVDTQNPDAPNSVIALDNVGPVVGAISNGQTTDDATPSLSGTGEPGATVTLYDGESPIGTAVVKPDGTWQFTPTTPLLDGAHSLSTTQTDVAGNTGPASAPTTFTLDTKDVVAPTITALRDDTGSVQGTVQADGVTDDTRPTLQGTAPAGTTVSVYDGTTLLGTVPADSAGRWAFTPSTPLADGPHVLSATATNAAGVVSPATAPYAVTVDTQGPAVPTITGLGDDVGSVQGALDEAARTDDTTPTLSGTGEPGATIKVYDGSDLIGTATVDPDGRWTLTPATPLTEGPHSFTATATDPAGNTGPASPAQTLVVDLTATAAPTLAIAEDANDNGVVNLAELSGKVDITIGLPAGARVGDVLNLTTSSGNQSLTITAEQLTAGQVLTQVDAPASGESLIARVTLTDAAGNTSASAGDAAAFDYKTPDASTTALVINPVSADNIVNAAEAGQTLQVTGQAQGEFSTGDTVTLNINGKSFTGIVAQDGSFSIAVPGADLAADPDHTVAGSLRATDPAGNQADIGAMRVFSVDTAATGAPTVTLVEDANNDGFINRAELNGLVIARVDLPQGAAVGDRVDISNGEVTNSIVLTAQDLSAGHVLTGFVAPPTGSTVAITATLTDVAGNTSAQGSDSARIDTSGPSSATTGISINPLTADNVINAAEAGGTVQVTGQATGEFTPGDVVTLSANGKTFTGTLGADGSFTVAVPGADLVADGDKTLDVSIRITDPAGNQADIPATRAYSVDTTATGTPTVTIAEDANNNGFISRAELNGVVDVRVDLPAGSVAGDSLSVSNGSTTSTFTLTPEQIAAGVVNTSFAAPAEGQLVQITAILTDMAGNASPQGSDAARIDTTGPSGGPGGTTGLVLDSLSADNVINAAEAGDSVRITGHATGEFTAGDTVTVEINGQSFSGQVAADGSFSIPVPGTELAVDPDKTVQASLRATDPAGNQADIAASRAYGVDISATGAPTVAIAEDTNSNGFISSAELNGVVDVRVGLPAGTVAGDTLTVSNGSTTASFVVSAAHLAAGFINTSFAAPAEGQTVNITAILTDIAGNASPQGTDAARIDTTGPSSATTGITINPVSADNIVNAADAAGTVNVTGQAIGEFTPGDVVTLTANGKTFTGTLGADGSFSVAVPGADLVADGDQTLDVSIRITDPAGNQADIPASRAYSVDTAATGAPMVTIAEDANNNGFISSAELNGVVDVRVALPAGTVAGDTLTVSNGSTTASFVVSAAHLAAGFINTSFAAPAEGQTVNITAILTDIAGNASPQGTDAARIDTTGPSSATTGITINPVSADNIVNAAEAAGTVNVTGQATGEFTPGDVVMISVNGHIYSSVIGQNGSFSVAVAGGDLAADADQRLDVTLQATDPAGNVHNVSVGHGYSVDATQTVQTTGDDTASRTVATPDGGYWLLFTSNQSGGQDSYGLYAQRFDATGKAVSAINTLFDSTDPKFQIGHSAVGGLNQMMGYDATLGADNSLSVYFTAGASHVGYLSTVDANGLTHTPPTLVPSPAGFTPKAIVMDVEMQQNDTTVWESPPVIETLADGRFIAIWSNNGLSDNIQNMNLQARIFNADGSPSTDQFQVGSWAVDGTDGYDVDTFTVKQLAGGQVVVGYVRNYAETGGDEPVYSIIDPSLSSNWVVRADLEMQQHDTTLWESPPVIEALSDGRFIAIWANNGLSDDTQSMMLQARIFNADGSPSTDQFQVGSWAVDGTDGYDVDNFTVKELAGGEVVVGYVRNYAETGGDEPVYSIIDPSLSSNWVVQADLEMQQNDTTVWESPPVIEALADGRFIAIWANNGLSDDTQSMMLQARIFNADGSPSTDQFQVGSWAVDGTDGYDVDNFTVKELAGGEVVVGYVRNYAETGGDEPVYSIIDPSLSSNWVVRADLEMQQNDTTVWESPPVIEALADGRFIAVWANNGLSDDTQSMKLQARVFNADGSPSTDQFQVGTRAVDGTDGYDVDNITVRQLASGEVVVGYVRNYAEAGGDEPVFTILGLQGKQIDPTLVSLPSGGQSLFYAADTGTGYDIYQVRVGTDGQPLANSATKVVDGLSHAGFQQDLGAIAGSSTGKTYALGSDGLGATQVSGDVVALTYSDVRNGDANVYMRLVDGKTGAVIGTEMAIAQSSAGLQMAPEITRLDDTTVVATWLSNSGSNNLGGMDVFTRRFHIDPVTHAVTPLDATDQLVSLQTDQSAGLLTGTLSAHHATAALVGGGYVVAWSQGGDIHAQRFDGEGHRLGEEYVHTSASATDLMPSVVGLQDGSYALSWTTNSQAGDLSASLANSAHNGNDVQTVVVKVSDEPATGITVNPVSADNIVNAAEASGTVNVTGQASGEFTPGDVVTITANGKTFTGTLGADGSFTVAVPGADLVADGDKTLDVLVRITDPTGHQADIPASRTYSVNTSVAGAPTVTISEDANNNGFISRTELNGALDVRVGLPAGAVAGDTLTVSNGTTSTHLVLTAAQVSAGHIDTSFAAPIEGQMVTITATLTDVTGNTSPQGSDAARIDTTGPSLLTTGITVHPVSADNVVNAAEAAGPVHVTGRATGEFTPGDVVTITANGKTFTGTLGADDSFTVAVPGADLVADGDKTLAVSARVTDPAGNQADIPATRTYSVDTAATGAPTVTISEDANNNGFISRGELNGVVDVRVGLPAGTVAGDTLTVSNGSITTHFTVTAAHLAAGFLNTSFAAPADGQMVNISAILTDIAGNASPQGIDAARIDTTGPSNAGTGLVLDALTADNVVNAAEAGAAIPVTGRATGEFTPGDTVTVTVNGKAFSGTVGANGSFNISVPGADLIADGDRMLDATLRATDAAGNQADIGASRVYSVDTTATGAPVVSLGEDSNNNGILSPAELNGVIDVRISLPAGAVSGDILTVSNGTTTMPFTLTAAQIAAGFIDTSFAAPTEDGTIQVTAVLTDQAGNSSPQGSDSARLDTTATAAPTVTIAEDINNNGFINAAELAGQVDVRITLPAGTVAGDTLTVTDGTTQRTFTLTAAQVSAGQVLTDFPPPAEGQVLNVTATLRDMAGNTSAPGSDSAQLDTTGPSGAGTGVTLDPLTADNVINAAEAGGTVAVTGRATGEFAEGDRVTVTVNGKTFIGTVAANGNFSVNVPGADLAADVDKTLDASLRATDAAGNQAEITASRAYTADTTATGAPTVTITEDANNNAFISAAELSGDVGVRITLPAGAQLGDTLTVSDGTTTDRYVLNAAQLANGFIDTSFAAPTEGGTISVTATLTDVAGNTSAQGLDSARVDTTGPSGATTSITFASVTADNVVNAAESGGSVNVTGSVAGEFRQGDTITLTVNGKTFSGTLAANGSFNVAVPGSDLAADGDRRIDASLRATDAAGNQADISANKSYAVDTTALATPTVTITDDSANDGWITPGEFNGALDVRVSMPAGTSVGDVLSVSNGLTWQNITITQTHLNQGFVATSFSMAFSGSATASAYITDAAGNPSGTGTDSVTFYDPLVMDLDGDGVETLAISEGVNFDLNGDGVKDRTGWVGKDDGLLVADLDNSGTIDSGRELFGDATLKTDGSQAQHGFEALADMDSNQDGKISVADTGFNALKIWQDADSDGLTDTGELKSLTEMGVVEINLSHSTGNDKQSGNFITMESTYLKSDGSVLEISDVWLRNNSTAGATQGDEAGVVHIADFNPATGDALDLRDLLSAEQGMDLSTYLDFDTTSQPGSTVVHVSTTGQFANGEYTPGASDQTIVLDGVDLRSAMGLGANSSDSQLIQTLLNQGKLLTDGGV